MSRTRKRGCRCRRGHGCKSELPEGVKHKARRDGGRSLVRSVLRQLGGMKFKLEGF